MLGAVIETEPDSLPALDFDRFESSNTRVVLVWTLLPVDQNGGSEVLGYEIKYQNDGAAWQTISIGATEVSYTVSGFTGGTTNLFTIAPFNKYGVAVHTPILSVVTG